MSAFGRKQTLHQAFQSNQFEVIILLMAKNIDDSEFDDLESYLVGLDELGSTITSDWATSTPNDRDSGVKDVHKALQELLHQSLTLSKAVDKN